MNYPYTDNDMYYDYNTHRYVLTNQFIFNELGEDIESNLNSPQMAKAFYNRISVLVYAYIHSHNSDTMMQDYILAKTKSGREIIRNAMLLQVIAIVLNGDWSLSSDVFKRENFIDITVKEELLKTIPEIGTTILYTGNLNFISGDTTGW